MDPAGREILISGLQTPNGPFPAFLKEKKKMIPQKFFMALSAAIQIRVSRKNNESGDRMLSVLTQLSKTLLLVSDCNLDLIL